MQPPARFRVHRLDVAAPDDVEIRWQHPTRRVKEALMYWIRIGTADQSERSHVVRRDHARVTGMKLTMQTLGAKLIEDGVNAVGYNQGRTFRALS